MNRRLRRNPLGSGGLLSVCLAWWLLMAVLTSWQAHLGGLLVGAVVGMVFGFAPRGRYRAWWQASGVAAVTGILVLLVVWQTGQSTWL